jgi:hypothetical protein
LSSGFESFEFRCSLRAQVVYIPSPWPPSTKTQNPVNQGWF